MNPRDRSQIVKLAQSLSVYDTQDLVASVGALLIVPSNADCFIRLEALAHAAASVVPGATSEISSSRLKSICNAGIIGEGYAASQDDPCNELFIETIPFFGGQHLVFPGMVENSAQTLRGFVSAICHPGNPLKGTAYYLEAYKLTRAVLLLSDAVAKKAGLQRGQEPISVSPRRVTIPNSTDLQDLKRAVSFTRGELAELLTPAGVTEGDLTPIIRIPGSVEMTEWTPGDHSALSVRPVIDFGSSIVVAIPGLVPAALYHALTLLAKEHGLLEELSRLLTKDGWNGVLRSLDFMGCPSLETPGRSAPLDTGLIDGFFRMDTDKALYALIVSEEFEDYPAYSQFGERPSENLVRSIRQCIDAGLTYHRESIGWSKRILVVLLIQSTGRSLRFATSAAIPGLPGEDYDFVKMTVHDLDVISVLEHSNPIAVWKFARAWHELQKRTRVLSFSTLDAYDFYRGHKNSFYFDDNVQPMSVSLDPGASGDIRREAHRRRDQHYALSADRLSFHEVISYRGDTRLPLYVSPKISNDGLAVLIEGPHIPIWVRCAMGDEEPAPGSRLVYFLLIDAISYWLSRLSSELHEALIPLSDLHQNLLVDLHLPTNENWETWQAQGLEVAEQDGPTVEFNFHREFGAVLIVVHNSFLSLCATPDNGGERMLMGCVLKAISRLLPESILTDDAILNMLDRQAPLGVRKMIIMPRSRSMFLLDDAGLPEFRSIQGADIELQLDELGEHLRSSGLRKGEIPEGDRLSVINDRVVKFFYEELRSVVSRLSPEGLLEDLIGRHEASLRQQHHLKLTTPTRLACFDFDTKLEERVHRDLAKADMTSSVGRFVIEYVAGQPPTGKEPLSLATYDRLLALTRQIMYYGFASDLIRYNLGRVRFSMLNSGRLGEDRAAIEAAWKRYGKFFADGRVRDAHKNFGRFWDADMSAGDADAATENPVEAEDEAMRAEFGHSLTDIAEMIHILINYSLKNGESVTVTPLTELVRECAEVLEWEKTKTTDLIDLLSLRARPEFLTAPAGFAGYDLWPWRFNRRLSYLRRPIIIRERDGVEEAVWGPKHAYQSGDYFADILFSGRLPPVKGNKHSPVMRSYQSRANGNRGKNFERRVLTALESVPHLRVRGTIKRFGREEVGTAGEIDAVVANTRTSSMFVLECKDLSLAKTPYEMGQQISQLYTDKPGEKSATSQALIKTQWIQDRLSIVLDELGLPVTPLELNDWKVVPVIVTDDRLFTTSFIDEAVSRVQMIPFEELLEVVEKPAASERSGKLNRTKRPRS